MGNVVCWSGVIPKSKWREPECHHVCREFLFVVNAPILPTLLCSQPGPGENRTPTLYLPVWSTGRGKFTV